MKPYFKLSITFVWLLTALSVFFLAEGFYLADDLYHKLFISLALMLFFIIWIIVITDLFNYPVYNKTFWFISFLIIPYIAVLVYLFLRNKLIMKEKKLEKRK